MTNIQRAKPEVFIELGGKSRALSFTFGALATIEKELGVNTLGNDFWKNLTARGVVAMLWAALKKGDPELTIDQVGDMLDFSDLGNVMEKLKEAMTQASPAPTKTEGKGK